MAQVASRQKFVWVFIGLVLGLVAGGLWPASPAHAVATAQIDSFSICTATVDDSGEALFFLDYLTGDLTGAMLNPNNGKFTAAFKTNVVADLGVDVTKSPKFLMVSGGMNFRRVVGAPQLGNAAIYVAELSSGRAVAYGVPWNSNWRNNATPIKQPLIPLDKFTFRLVEVR